MAGQLKVNGVTLATEESGTVTLEAPQIKDSSNNVILDQSGANPVLKNVEVVNNSSMMFRNKIINGDMRIDQRNAGGEVTLNSTFVFPVDHFRTGGLGSWSGSADIRAIQSTDAPAGFEYSLKIYTNTTASSSASDNYAFTTNVEGYDITDINFGTNDAKTLNLSFYVKGTTGTYGLSFNCGNGIYTTTYTVTSNWNRIVISIPKNVAYTPDSLTNGYGCWIVWDLGAGSDFETTSVNEWRLYTAPRKVRTSSCIQFGSTTGAELYITGVQLEVGTVATQFEHRPYGVELSLCQRYYATSESGYQLAVDIQDASFPSTNFPVTMRTSPTATVYAANDATANTMSRFGGNKCNVSSVSTYPNGIRLIQHDSESEGQPWGYRWTADAEL